MQYNACLFYLICVLSHMRYAYIAFYLTGILYYVITKSHMWFSAYQILKPDNLIMEPIPMVKTLIPILSAHNLIMEPIPNLEVKYPI